MTSSWHENFKRALLLCQPFNHFSDDHVEVYANLPAFTSHRATCVHFTTHLFRCKLLPFRSRPDIDCHKLMTPRHQAMMIMMMIVLKAAKCHDPCEGIHFYCNKLAYQQKHKNNSKASNLNKRFFCNLKLMKSKKSWKITSEITWFDLFFTLDLHRCQAE